MKKKRIMAVQSSIDFDTTSKEAQVSFLKYLQVPTLIVTMTIAFFGFLGAVQQDDYSMENDIGSLGQ